MDEGEKFDIESDEKLCWIIESQNRVDLDCLRPLVKDSRFICSMCGRSAANAEHLCAPEIL
jgi:hypothetical protein